MKPQKKESGSPPTPQRGENGTRPLSFGEGRGGAWLIILACAAGYFLNIYLATGIYDLSDGLAHFAIARYAPTHPELFLDHWGKPVFTLLAAPFAQFGIQGIMLMNTLLFVFTAWFTIGTARQLGVRQTWAAPMLIALAPAYFYTTMGGLTEVLFAFVLSAGLYFISREKYVAAALFIAFLPFVRSEGYAIWPLFMLAFLLKRQWLAAALLFVGPLVYGIAGHFMLDNFWWFITDNPNTGAKDIYGQGKWRHFLDTFTISTGYWLGWVALVGSAVAAFFAIKNWRSKQSLAMLLAVLSFLAVLFVHSYAWWQGLYGSLGLVRVLATVLPAMVLVVLYLFSTLENLTYLKPFLSGIAALLLVISSWGDLSAIKNFAKQADPQEKVIQDLAVWRDSSKHAANANIWYMHPAVGYYLAIDNFAVLDSRQFWYLSKLKPSINIRQRGLLIYDGKHAPNEGNIAKEDLLADPDLVLVESFSPKDEMVELNGFPFEVLVFEKKLNLEKDTLVFENFTKPRPLLAGRLQRLSTDTLGTPYFDMVGWSHFVPVFTFWRADNPQWATQNYRFWYDATDTLEVWLNIQYTDGRGEDRLWQEGEFALPEMPEDVVNITIFLRNAQPDIAVRLYSFGLYRVQK
jgi:hypothetical protein